MATTTVGVDAVTSPDHLHVIEAKGSASHNCIPDPQRLFPGPLCLVFTWTCKPYGRGWGEMGRTQIQEAGLGP